VFGNQILPVDKNGIPIIPKKANGQPLIEVDKFGVMKLKTDEITGRIVNPCFDNLNKTGIFKTDISGNVILPVDQFGR